MKKEIPCRGQTARQGIFIGKRIRKMTGGKEKEKGTIQPAECFT